MKVLLLSPLAGIDPANGDVTYTQELLERPPAGVEYVDYADALARGDLLERGRPSELARRQGLAKAGPVVRAIVAKPLDTARRRELLFREPLRFFEVRPGAFDLVHTHVFSVGYRGNWPPIVTSNSVSVDALYGDGLGWDARKVARSVAVERGLARALRVDHSTYHRVRSARLLAFTQHLKDWWVARGVADTADIDVVPCTVARQLLRTLKSTPRVVGFFAGSPEIKGLDRAFRAFEALRAGQPDVELHVIGAAGPTPAWAHVAAAPGVTWVGRRDRAELLSEVLPQLDVLVHPTRFDGLPLSVLEAMSVGVPVITSDYRALPEVVGDSRLVAVTATELTEALVRSLHPGTNHDLSTRAQERHRTAYSPEAVSPLLWACYLRAVTALAG